MTNILSTDGYKFSMAMAGWPLRQETFYYSHRRGGPHYLPLDLVPFILDLLPSLKKQDEADSYLRSHGYHMGGAYWAAMSRYVEIRALPKGCWFFDREPVFTATGPSALVSWLEPLALQIHYRIQVATLALLNPDRLPAVIGTVTCNRQREIALETLDSVEVQAPEIQVDPENYFNHVLAGARGLILEVKDPSRIFEVGMRAATCMEQHEIALRACREAGIEATSNVFLAEKLGMKPVGTMGHEHVQRYGSDEAAFRAMRDRFPGPSSFLLDTFDTIHSGLPEAFRLISEEPDRGDTVRFDSGDIQTQYLIACSMAKHQGINPRFILEDGFTRTRTARFESLRAFTGINPEDQLYGYGGYLVKAPGDPLTRDRVAAVWKLTQSGRSPTMKFGNESGSGKESIPGEPDLLRIYDGSTWRGLVVQRGEEIATHLDGVLLSGRDELPSRLRFTPDEALGFQKCQGDRPEYSPFTRELVDHLTHGRT